MKKIIDKHIRQLPDGRFRVDIRLSRKERPRRTFINREDARSFVRKILLEREDEKSVKRGLKRPRLRIMDVIDEFEQYHVGRAASTLKRYQPIFQYLREFCIANNITLLSDFSQVHASLLQQQLMAPCIDPKGSTGKVKTRQAKTVNMYISKYKTMFNREVRKRSLQFNPFDHIESLPVQKRPPEYYKDEQLRAFFRVEMHPAHKDAFFGMLHTGARFSEIAELKWTDVFIDEDMPYLRIWASPDGSLKTGNAYRLIPINEDLLRVLRRIREQDSESDLVFMAPQGGKLRERAMLAVCSKVAKRAGIGHGTNHLFRHTFATKLAELGFPVQYISRLMGHATIAQTMRYIHMETRGLGHVVQDLVGIVPISD
ncbi:site-specific integrase [bacterium]|nr:site-specific integrase [bacterium]